MTIIWNSNRQQSGLQFFLKNVSSTEIQREKRKQQLHTRSSVYLDEVALIVIAFPGSGHWAFKEFFHYRFFPIAKKYFLIQSAMIVWWGLCPRQWCHCAVFHRLAKEKLQELVLPILRRLSFWKLSWMELEFYEITWQYLCDLMTF